MGLNDGNGKTGEKKSNKMLESASITFIKTLAYKHAKQDYEY